MRKRFDQFLDPLLNPGPVPLIFIVGIILLSLISDAVYALVQRWLTTPLNILLFGLGAIVVLLLLYRLLQQLFQRKIIVRPIRPRPGLIVLISQGRLEEIPASTAIRYHFRGEADEREKPTLKHCWLVTSPKSAAAETHHLGGPQSAWQNALDLKQQYGDQVYMSIVEIDPDDPADIYTKINNIYSEARSKQLRPADIVADFSGGTKMMSVGMVLACTPSDRDVEYLKPRQLDERGRAISAAGADPKLVDLRFFPRISDDYPAG